MRNVGKNKQAAAVKGAEELTQRAADHFRVRLEQEYKEAEDMYQWALGVGVPKELARLVLPVGRYSRMRAQANLRNWLAFVTLRSDPNAQWEIQEFSRAVEQILAEVFPRTYDLFLKRRSAQEHL